MSRTTDAPVIREFLASGVIATGAREWVPAYGAGMATFQGVVTGTGAVTATVAIEISNDGTNSAGSIGTLNLSGTTSASEGFALNAPWAFVRANVTAISGTGATVNVIRGR